MSEVIVDEQVAPPTAVVSAPPMQTQHNSPSLSRKPLLSIFDHEQHSNATSSIVVTNDKGATKTAFGTPRFVNSPLGSSPIRRAIMLTRLDPQDAWLPITESRNGNAFYAAFHTLCAGIGIQALVLPVAFTVLGWTWGIICLTVAFVWQLYTFWVLTNLHESTENGMRYSRFLQLFSAAFGERMGKIFALFPILYLSGGTCVALIVVGGSTSKLFYQIVCGGHGCSAKPLTNVEWYLIFATAAVIVSQLPNLNSIAGVSLIGAVTAIGYCTMMWLVSVTEGRVKGVSYDRVKPNTNTEWFFGVLNALGIIAFAFRGHNVTLEIQATMPSSEKKRSRVPMWRGIQAAYFIVALCLYPLAIAGYWAYGNKIPENGGMLSAIYTFHGRDTSPTILGLISLFVIINALSTFQIYGMPMFDDMESQYTKHMKKPCPWWLRAFFRVMAVYGCFFVAVAIPFLGSLAGLIGGIAVTVDSSKSTSGYIYTIDGTAVSWMSRLQKCVALSSTEAEYVAIAEVGKEMIWLVDYLEELGKKQRKRFLYTDNQSVIQLVKNPVYHSKTKHIRRWYHFIRRAVEEGDMCLEKIEGEKNPADMLTKCVDVRKLRLCKTLVGLQ